MNLCCADSLIVLLWVMMMVGGSVTAQSSMETSNMQSQQPKVMMMAMGEPNPQQPKTTMNQPQMPQRREINPTPVVVNPVMQTKTMEESDRQRGHMIEPSMEPVMGEVIMQHAMMSQQQQQQHKRNVAGPIIIIT